MFAVYVICWAQEKDAVRLALEQIDVVRRMCTEYQDFELVTSTQGIVRLNRAIYKQNTRDENVFYVIFTIMIQSVYCFNDFIHRHIIHYLTY